MTTHTTRLLGAAFMTSLAVPAFAGSAEPVQTEAVPAPVVMPVASSSSDWTGGYVGLQLGYGEVTDGLEGNETIGGVQAGYDWDLGDWVVGIGADANFGSIETSAGDLDSLSRLKVRGGYDFGKTLVYATTGASYAASSDLGDEWGYFGGIGVETKLTDTVSLTGEIATHRFDEYGSYGSTTANTATIGVNYRF
ncbi:opacity protein-like surface antigen [Aliiruegeria haliotis]|uniref:Opacity protein-like surface antigen n=1 Tax=Aliiruegeria haliotis TaxID=1280846 RepID=A0A2T0S003_9RHOB|nr:outer membrane beta-barrel protein [Aliiruegeria haliotis]PRY26633.1 opacity protein-like surface antigen [Aliiruegeria haliotis]